MTESAASASCGLLIQRSDIAVDLQHHYNGPLPCRGGDNPEPHGG
jgi:hypothetical protein